MQTMGSGHYPLRMHQGSPTERKTGRVPDLNLPRPAVLWSLGTTNDTGACPVATLA